jgi:hypothetical protein
MSDPSFRVVKEVPRRAFEAKVKSRVIDAIPYLFANLGEWCLLFSKPAPAPSSKFRTSHQDGTYFKRALEERLAVELGYHSGSYDVESKRHIAIDEVTGERYTGVWFRVSYNELNEYANGTHKYHDLGLIAQDLSGDLERAIALCDLASDLS